MSVSKNNIQNKLQADARRVPHWSLRKLSVGVASVLLGTTFYFGMSNVAHADVVSPGQASGNNAQVTQAGDQSAGLQSNSVNLQAGNSGAGSNTVQNLAGPSAAGVPQSAANSGSAGVPAPSQGTNAAGQSAQSAQPATAMPFVALFEQPASGASSDVVWDASKDTELQKDVTETIHVVDQNNQATDHAQTVHFTRTKQADGSFSDWTTDGNATMPAFNLPQVKGYTAYDMDGGDAVTPDGKQVRAVHVTGNMDNFKVRVAYRANQIYSQIQFIDDDGNVVATQDINGTEGASVHVGTAHDVLPWGYNFSNAADVNKAITITDGMSAPQIHVKAMMLRVDHQAPIDYSTQFNTPQGDEPYPSGLSDADLNRTIERTINITDANGHTTSVKQTLHAHRDVDVNMATYFINYGAWEFDNDKTDWDAYSVDVPAGQDLYIDGVKATTNQVPKVAVTFDTVSVVTNVRLVKQDRSVQVIFYDADQAGANPNQEAMDEDTVAQTEVNGYVGDPVDFSKIDTAAASLEAGYTPKYPANTVVSVDNNQVIYVPVSAKTITVNHDQPKNPGDAIDGNPDDTYPDGLKDSDLNQTITRTINVTVPNGHGKNQTVTQVAKIHRDATVNVVTGEVTYGNWTTGKWSNYDVPTVPGYTASQNEVPATEVISDMTDQTIDISYTANSQTIHINYVDDDKAGEIVHATTVTGKTGETVNLNLTVPDKYQLADGQQLPTTYTFTAGSGDLTIHLVHKVVQREATVDVQIGFTTLVDPDDEGDPGIVVTQNQWTQLDDEIKKSYNDNLGKVDPTVEVGTLTGHVNYDLVDNKVVSFGNDWTTLNLGGQTYQMPDGTEVVNGVMLNSSIVWGKKLKELLLKYSPDADPDYATYSWHGYLSVNKSIHTPSDFLVGNESNALAKATDDRAATAIEMPNQPIDLSSLDDGLSDFTEQDGHLRAKAIVPVEGVYIPYVEKTATRTINVTTPDGKTTSVKQTTTLAKRVTGQEDAHPVWTTGEWVSYDVPTIPGYTASQSNVAKETVTGTTKDQTVNITYTANDQTTHIIYVDGDGNTVKSYEVSGKTDQTVDTNATIPTGWVLSHGQTPAPSTITFKGASTPDTKITVEHGTRHVDHKTPDQPDTKTPTGKAVTGTQASDLNQTITRTVNITEPVQKMATTTQTAKIYRDATVDEVTGEVTYGDWSMDTTNWTAVNVPMHAGYTTHISNGADSIPAVTVKDGQQSETITVTYTANAQTGKIVYVDADNKNVEVGHTDLTGNTDQDVTITPKAPAGYDIVAGQDIPATEKATADGIATVTVKVNHHKRTVNPGDEPKPGDKIPGNPNKQPGDGTPKTDVSYETLHRNMTRTVNVTDPHTGLHTTTVVLHYNRTATIDDVTGEVTYGNWTVVDGSQAGFDAFNIPTVAGYTSEIKTGSAENLKALTPSQDQITNWSDQTVDIDYTANNQTMHITYVDKAGHPVDGGSFTVTGKTDQTVATNAKIPTGWVLSQGQTDAPKTVTFGGTPTADVTVKIEHGTTHVDHSDPVKSDGKTPANKTINGAHDNDLNRTVTRTINVHMPDGTVQTKQQVAKIYRDATVDDVTGDVTYGAWSTDATDWVAYTAPVVDGWTADKSVEAATVKENTMNTTIDINYTANDQSVLVTFYDQTGKKVDSQTINGKTGQTVDANSVIPDGWVLYDGQTVPTKITFGAENNNHDFVISHLVAFVPASANVSQGDVIKGTNSKTYPAGVSHNDLNKTITRTIHVTNIDGTTTDHVQSVQFVRNAQVDAVTGDVTYGTWSEGATHVFAGFTPQAKDGYTVDSAKSVVVTPTGSNSEVTLAYHVAPKTITVNYVTEAGTIVSSMANVVPDKSGNIKLTAPNGYVLLTDGNTIKAASAKDQVYNVTVKADSHVVTSHDTNLPASVAKDQLVKTVTRKVMITMPNGKTRTVTQRVTFTRTADVTADGHLISYNDWQATGRAQFNKVFLVPRMGYQISVDGVLGGSVNKVAVTPDMADTTIVVNYVKK